MSASSFLEENASAVDLRLGGRYSLANRRDMMGNRREFACRTTRVSPSRMLVEVPVMGPVGERVITYFGEFGTLDGWISDHVVGGFLIDLQVTRSQREKLASKITWITEQQKQGLVDNRKQERVVPQSPHSTLVLHDGTTVCCFVINMSVSGVAVSSDLQPAIGMPLAVGRVVGRVVRHFREGFAVKFIEQQEPDLLERMLIRV